jgi:hypothetical protein
MSNELTVQEAYEIASEVNGRRTVGIGTIQELTGMDKKTLHQELEAAGAKVDQEPFSHRITQADRRYAVDAGDLLTAVWF